MKVLIATNVDQRVPQHLRTGGKVLLAPRPDRFSNSIPGGFSPVFWNQAWAKGQEPQTVGLLIQEMHPALAKFPMRTDSDWQWHKIAIRARPVILDGLPRLTPIVQPIDHWNRNVNYSDTEEHRLKPHKLRGRRDHQCVLVHCERGFQIS